MYGSMALLFEPSHNLLRGQFFLIRALNYPISSSVFDHIRSFLIFKITGKMSKSLWDALQSYILNQTS